MKNTRSRITQKEAKQSIMFLEIASGNRTEADYFSYECDKKKLAEMLLTHEQYEKLSRMLAERHGV